MKWWPSHRGRGDCSYCSCLCPNYKNGLNIENRLQNDSMIPTGKIQRRIDTKLHRDFGWKLWGRCLSDRSEKVDSKGLLKTLPCNITLKVGVIKTYRYKSSSSLTKSISYLYWLLLLVWLVFCIIITSYLIYVCWV